MKILYNNHKKFDKSRENRRYHQETESQPRKKKSLGQHFLRKQSVVDNMIDKVVITPETSIMEIGCGDGFLTQAILSQVSAKKLRCYEIDHEWATYVTERIKDPRLEIKLQNILNVDFQEELGDKTPWVILANLPYQITFPILFKIQENKHLFTEGVVMVQEEVAQKIVATGGRAYNPTSIFLQHHFNLELMERIEPGAFTPPPKVFSRLLYFKPKAQLEAIPQEEKFRDFLKLCFRSPRQTLRNNLKSTHFNNAPQIPAEMLSLRAQQITTSQFIELWKLLVA